MGGGAGTGVRVGWVVGWVVGRADELVVERVGVWAEVEVEEVGVGRLGVRDVAVEVGRFVIVVAVVERIWVQFGALVAEIVAELDWCAALVSVAGVPLGSSVVVAELVIVKVECTVLLVAVSLALAFPVPLAVAVVGIVEGWRVCPLL